MKAKRTTKKLRRRGRNTARGWLAQALKTYLKALESTEPETPRAELNSHIQEFVQQILLSQNQEPRSCESVSTILNEMLVWLSKELDVPTQKNSIDSELLRRQNHVSTETTQAKSTPYQGLTPLHQLPVTPPVPQRPTLKRGADDALTQDCVSALRDFHPEIVLVSPQIPPNTGTIARLCAAFSCRLHLIEPLGFDVSEKSFRRAGLDYWPHVELYVHPTWEACLAQRPGRRVICVETGGRQSPSEFQFQPGDLLVFGAETFGIPQNILAYCSESQRGHVVTIPMFHRGVRSLNLANSVSIVTHCALNCVHADAAKVN